MHPRPCISCMEMDDGERKMLMDDPVNVPNGLGSSTDSEEKGASFTVL